MWSYGEARRCQALPHTGSSGSARSLHSQARIHFGGPESSESLKRIEAELKSTVLIDIPMAFHDVLSSTANKLILQVSLCFKATLYAKSPMLVENLVQQIKYSLSTDGSGWKR